MVDCGGKSFKALGLLALFGRMQCLSSKKTFSKLKLFQRSSIFVGKAGNLPIEMGSL
jgi:hypothetical protein